MEDIWDKLNHMLEKSTKEKAKLDILKQKSVKNNEKKQQLNDVLRLMVRSKTRKIL